MQEKQSKKRDSYKSGCVGEEPAFKSAVNKGILQIYSNLNYNFRRQFGLLIFLIIKNLRY